MMHLKPEKIPIASVTDGTSHTLHVGEVTIAVTNPGCKYTSEYPPYDQLEGCTYGQWAGMWTVGSVTHGLNFPCRNTYHHGNQFASYHPGIVNFLLADGSVHPLNETISWHVLAALATRAGGDQVDPTEL